MDATEHWVPSPLEPCQTCCAGDHTAALSTKRGIEGEASLGEKIWGVSTQVLLCVLLTGAFGDVFLLS